MYVHMCVCVCTSACVDACEGPGLSGSQALKRLEPAIPPRQPCWVVIQSLLCPFRGSRLALSGGNLFHLHTLLAVRKFFWLYQNPWLSPCCVSPGGHTEVPTLL